MSIEVGSNIPNVTLKVLGESGLEDVSTGELFAAGKVAMFSVPGAFTPTCSNTHLPGFVQNADAIKGKGVEKIICLAVNDPFVMKAWEQAQGATGKVFFLADGNGEFTKALGLETDISGAGLGIRGKRFLLVANKGVVESIEVESGKGVTVSGAEACISKLG